MCHKLEKKQHCFLPIFTLYTHNLYFVINTDVFVHRLRFSSSQKQKGNLYILCIKKQTFVQIKHPKTLFGLYCLIFHSNKYNKILKRKNLQSLWWKMEFSNNIFFISYSSVILFQSSFIHTHISSQRDFLLELIHSLIFFFNKSPNHLFLKIIIKSIFPFCFKSHFLIYEVIKRDPKSFRPKQELWTWLYTMIRFLS